MNYGRGAERVRPPVSVSAGHAICRAYALLYYYQYNLRGFEFSKRRLNYYYYCTAVVSVYKICVPAKIIHAAIRYNTRGGAVKR